MSRLTFPQSACDSCGERPGCAARGRLRPSYPACHTRLGVDLARVGELIDAWGAASAPGEPALLRLRDRLLEVYAADRAKRSDVFEPSISWDGRAARLWRFSYGFPAFSRQPDAVTTRLLSLAAPFGEPTRSRVEALLGTAHEPCVRLPIFGVARDGGASHRVKLYLLFHDDAGDAALRLAERLIPTRAPRLASAGRPLHMVGIDLGPDGFVGAKLYFVEPTIDTSSPPPDLPPTRFLDELASAGIETLRNVLVIHRLRAPDDADAATPRELDFELEESDLDWRDVVALPSIAPHVAPGSAFARLDAEFSLAVRRLSVSTGSSNKTNAYYLLREVEGSVD